MLEISVQTGCQPRKDLFITPNLAMNKPCMSFSIFISNFIIFFQSNQILPEKLSDGLSKKVWQVTFTNNLMSLIEFTLATIKTMISGLY